MSAFRSASSTPYGVRTNTTVNKPAGVVANDVMLAWFLIGSSTTPPVPSFSGWNVVGGTWITTSTDLSGFTLRAYLAWRPAGASEPASYTFNHASASTECVIVAYSGVDNTNPIDVYSSPWGTGTSTTSTAPSVTTAAANESVVFFEHDWGDTTTTLSGPTGFTKRLQSTLSYVSDATQATAAATGSKSITNQNNFSGNPWAAGLVALKNAPAGGGSASTSDSVPVSTSLARSQGTQSRSTSDSVPASTSLARSAGVKSRAASDSVPVATSLARAQGTQSRSTSDSVPVATSLARTAGVETRSTSDDATVSTSLAGASGSGGRQLADDVTVSTSLARSAGVKTRSTSDDATVSTSLAGASGSGDRQLADDVTVSTSLARSQGTQARAVADSVPVGTSLGRSQGVQTRGGGFSLGIRTALASSPAVQAVKASLAVRDAALGVGVRDSSVGVVLAASGAVLRVGDS